MSLRKRAVSGILVAGLLVMMGAVAAIAKTTEKAELALSAEQAADTERAAVPEFRTDLAANGRAGAISRMNELETGGTEALDEIETGIEQTAVELVAEAETPEQAEEQIPATEEPALVTEEPTPATEEPALEPAEPTEELAWQNRLMAEVEEFLYVRAAGNPEAEVVGKMYKGAVAVVVEVGEEWSRVVSGNVDGWVKNDYCVFGTDAMNYAKETVETAADVQANGLRVRSEAALDGDVVGVVSTGMTLTVDTDAAAADGWVAVHYGGKTNYVSADYVTTELKLGKAITIAEEQEAIERKRKEEEEKARKAAEKAAAAAKSAAAQKASAGNVQGASVPASVDDVTLLAALIQCEAGSEPYEGQLAVGAVVMNRVKSGRYAGDIRGVIYQSGQFPPARNGLVSNVLARGPKGSCVQAAQEAIGGMDNTGGALRFKRASSGQAGVVIGNHVFY